MSHNANGIIFIRIQIVPQGLQGQLFEHIQAQTFGPKPLQVYHRSTQKSYGFGIGETMSRLPFENAL